MPLYLVRFEHEDENVTCCLVRARFERQAHDKVDKWLSRDCIRIGTNSYLDLEDNDTLRIEGISEIERVDDLEKCLPLIDGFLPNGEGVVSGRNN
jgi:hypothetical protein